MPKIFLSYRRQDSWHVTGRIFDKLEERFGKKRIFKDVDSIPLGRDFRKVLAKSIGQCDVLVAMIGDQWLTANDDSGRRRLDDEADFVRIEIELALKRGIPIIPLLVDGTPMPSPDELPASIRELAFRNAALVRPDPDFRNDVDRLIRALERISTSTNRQSSRSSAPVVAGSRRSKAVPPAKPRRASDRKPATQQPRGIPLPPRRRLVAAGLGALALVVALVAVLYVNTNYGTIRIELNDPGPGVEVKVDGESVEVTGLNEPLRFRAGDHRLLVTAGDYETLSKSFSVRRGKNPILRVELQPKAVAKASIVGPPAQPTQTNGATPKPPSVSLETAGKTITNSIGMKLVLIPEGEFMMGSPASEEGRKDHEGPQHRVRITKPFYMGQTEVTQGQWETVMETKPWVAWLGANAKETSDYPATHVAWEDAKQFCERLSRKESGVTYRLPTEAEWEYACRAGTTSRYYFGDSETLLTQYEWWIMAKHGGSRTLVGGKKPNPFGLFDMCGNVFEWCSDWYGVDYYGQSSLDDPQGPAAGSLRVFRGGCWLSGTWACRSAYRYGSTLENRHGNLGFRVARSPSSQ